MFTFYQLFVAFHRQKFRKDNTGRTKAIGGELFNIIYYPRI